MFVNICTKPHGDKGRVSHARAIRPGNVLLRSWHVSWALWAWMGGTRWRHESEGRTGVFLGASLAKEPIKTQESWPKSAFM